MFLLCFRGISRHVPAFGSLLFVEDGWSKTVVEIGVGLDEEMPGEELAAVAEGDLQQIIRLGAPAFPALMPGFQSGGKADGDHQ